MTRLRARAAARAALLAACCAALAACARSPIVWGDIARTPGAPPPGWRIVLDAAGHAMVDATPVAPFTPPAGACAGSVALAPMTSREWYAAWWQRRADGSAALDVARSVDGGTTWSVPSTADGRDQGGGGSLCDRPAPAIAADSASGYVHLAYYLRPAGGPGIWFTHSMDHGATWHAPVGIFYGDDPAAASVAAHGDTVAVAYEFPLSSEPRVGVALSRTAGHIFDVHATVSSGDEVATQPRVAVRGRTVAVAWVAREPDAPASAPAVTAIRIGTLH